MPQQFIETVLELDGLSLKNRDIVNQPLTEMMKLEPSDKKTIAYPMEVSHLSKMGRERKWTFPGTGSGFHTSKNRQR